MAEYLALGVYLEELSYRSKAIDGVSTGTGGFAAFGPRRLLMCGRGIAVDRARRRRRPPLP